MGAYPLKVQTSDFQSTAAGRLLSISGYDSLRGEDWSVHAYVPHQLPTEPALSFATLTLLSEADRAIGRLDANLQLLPNPSLLVQPTLSKEAVSTSALEGTFATLKEVLEADFEDDNRSTAPVREVRNYIRAANLGLDLIKEKPVCLTLISELQAVLVRGTRGDAYDSGGLRQRQVFIGDHGRPVEEARFVPCPPGDLLGHGMSDWEKWVNAENEVPLLVKVALAHYQFETLHPFSDGNGRVGRLIITLQLIASGVLHYPVFNLASWLEPRRESYVGYLLRTSMTGDFDPLVAFFAEGIRDCAEATCAAVERLLHESQGFTRLVRESGDKSFATQLAGDLIGYPMLEVSDVAQRYKVAYPTANNAVKKLVSLGILENLNARSYGRVFFCPRVYAVLISL